MEACEVTHYVSDGINVRSHIDPEKLRALFKKAIYDNGKISFSAHKLGKALELDQLLTQTVFAACRSSGLLINMDLESVKLLLQTEYWYCKSCAEAALKYCATPLQSAINE